MCGFAGIIHWDREPVDQPELDGMVERLRHRGPDQLRAARPEPGVGLAHARLKVIDCSELAAQPMASQDGRRWLVYNGEVYNFRELRRELEADGARFASHSDTEVILRAYEAWGVEALRRFDGMFALALWDGLSRQLILARDRIGKKPLFYWTDGRCLVFASEIKALLAHRHVPCDVDEAALPFLLTFGYPPAGSTCYRDIHQLSPASLACVSEECPTPEPQPYWRVSFDSGRNGTAHPADPLEVRRRLDEAVRKRLVADVPLGAFLSGGIDSTIIVGLMAQHARQPVKTFSIGFEGDAAFDETWYARLAAERFGTEHTVFTVGPQPVALIERLVWHHDQPFGDSSALPAYLLCQLAREHVTVALSGDGGDELFAGYRRFMAACRAASLPRGLAAAADALLRRLPAARERSWLGQLKRFTDGARRGLPGSYLRWLTYCDDAEQLMPRASAGAMLSSMAEGWARTAGRPALSRLLELNFTDYLPNDLMVKTDRCSMAHGLEVRSPLLDTALIEYVAALPAEPGKRLLKRACQDLLPPAIARRRKMGFGVPLGAWFRGQWRGPLQDLLDAPTARLARYLDHRLVRETIGRHLRGEEDAGQRLWLLLTIELWLRQLPQMRRAPAPVAANPAYHV
jgi:asparagine synthase (glutamine-hydrolysing)